MFLCLPKVLVLAYYHERLQEVDLPFSVPELWDCWIGFVDLSESILKLLILDCQRKCMDSMQSRDSLSLLLTHIRWTISRLLELQNSSKLVEL
jgi:hypothetical protein